ncbi:hypothetical protein, partial [Pseudomonas aeruginosa]|uniref:hypothetical protein n=1 Tax=Pseudomonas aeruginosa TaxID=287 RepID=UPI001D01C489
PLSPADGGDVLIYYVTPISAVSMRPTEDGDFFAILMPILLWAFFFLSVSWARRFVSETATVTPAPEKINWFVEQPVS